MPVKLIFANNPLQNNQYLIFTESTTLIDPFDYESLNPILEKEGRKVDFIINTHGHWDHIRGNEYFLKRGARIHCPSFLEKIETPGHTLDSCCYLLKENSKVKACFTGDTLFESGVGNCKNGGDVDKLIQSILKLDSVLEDQSILYFGHDYAENNKAFRKTYFKDLPDEKETGLRTWGEEKKDNVFLKALFDPSFLERYFRGERREEAFKKIRELRDQF